MSGCEQVVKIFEAALCNAMIEGKRTEVNAGEIWVLDADPLRVSYSLLRDATKPSDREKQESVLVAYQRRVVFEALGPLTTPTVKTFERGPWEAGLLER